MEVMIDGGLLTKEIATHKKLVGKDNSRPTLMGLNIRTEGSNLILTALDGFRMLQSVISKDVVKDGDDINVTIPVPDQKYKGSVLIKFFDKHLEIQSSDGSITIHNYMAEPYFNTESMMPNFCDFEIMVNPKLLAEVLMGFKDNTAIMLQFTKSTSPIEISSPDRKGLVLPVRISGEVNWLDHRAPKYE